MVFLDHLFGSMVFFWGWGPDGGLEHSPGLGQASSFLFLKYIPGPWGLVFELWSLLGFHLGLESLENRLAVACFSYFPGSLSCSQELMATPALILKGNKAATFLKLRCWGMRTRTVFDTTHIPLTSFISRGKGHLYESRDAWALGGA